MHSGAGPIIDRRHGNEAVGAEDVLIGGRQARAHPAPPHPPSDADGRRRRARRRRDPGSSCLPPSMPARS